MCTLKQLGYVRFASLTADFLPSPFVHQQATAVASFLLLKKQRHYLRQENHHSANANKAKLFADNTKSDEELN